MTPVHLPPRVKICGLTRPEDAAAAEAAGADFVGVVLVPGSPRTGTPELAQKIGAAVSIPLVLVVDPAAVDRAGEWAVQAGARVIQLHGGGDPERLARLREEGPWELWAGLRVRSEREIQTGLTRFSGVVDLLLLDAWHPTLKGGTGDRFPWEAVDELRPHWPRGLGLGVAGGLTPENVGEAVGRMRPDLVDVSSGVEMAPGVKSRERVRAFVEQARAAGRPGGATEPGPHGGGRG